MVSVVVPCYKTEKLLARCIDSLLCQEYRNMEVICVNDGSPDGCLSVIQQYVERYPGRVRLVDRENGGLWNARWSGTDVAKGDYVAYVDSDDYVEPNFVSDFVSSALENDSDIVVCGFCRVDEETKERLTHEMDKKSSAFFANQEPLRLIEINPAAWNKAFRRDLLLRMHRLDHPPAILEDVALSQLAYIASSGKVSFTGSAPYNYMIHKDSMINTVTLPQIESVKKALLEIKGYFEQDGVGDDLKYQLDAISFLHLGVSLSFRVSSNPDIPFGSYVKETTQFLDQHFGSWRNSSCINRKSARKSPALGKLYFAALVYKAHLMAPFLAVYRFMIQVLHVDIKW